MPAHATVDGREAVVAGKLYRVSKGRAKEAASPLSSVTGQWAGSRSALHASARVAQRRSVVRVRGPLRGAKAAWRRPSGRASVRFMGILLFSSAKLRRLLHAAMPAPRQARRRVERRRRVTP